MRCKCGFENAADARFCGSCRAALGQVPANAVPSASVRSTPIPVPIRVGKAGGRRLSRAGAVIAGTVVVVAAIGYWWLNRPPERFKVDNNGLYRINVNGKFGYMDRSGKTVITPQFDWTYSFLDGLAAVRVGNKFGFIDTKGVMVITPQFDAVSGFSEGLAALRVGTKFGYIDKKGLVAITPQFDDVTAFHNGRAAVKLCCGRNWDNRDAKIGHIGNNRYGFINKEGKYIGTPDFLFVQSDALYGIRRQSADATLVRTADDHVGILNRSGKVVIADKVDEFSWDDFTDGLAPVATGGKWGYINSKGDWIIAPQFEQAFWFEDGLAPVQVGQRWGLIDRKGKFVVNPQYDGVSGISEGYAIFESGKGSVPGCSYCGIFGIIDTKGQVVVDAKFVQHLDANGAVQRPVGAFSEGLAAVKTDDGWGFIDATGKMVIKPQFDSAETFQDGMARVMIADKIAYITKTGTFVGEPLPLPRQPGVVQAEPANIGANQLSAVSSLRTLNTAEITYASTYKAGWSPDLASLGGPPMAGGIPTPRQALLIDEQLASGVKDGYRFTYQPQVFGGRFNTYALHADPVTPGITGTSSYFTDQTGVIRESQSGPAGPDSPPIAG